MVLDGVEGEEGGVGDRSDRDRGERQRVAPSLRQRGQTLRVEPASSARTRASTRKGRRVLSVREREPLERAPPQPEVQGEEEEPRSMKARKVDESGRKPSTLSGARAEAPPISGPAAVRDRRYGAGELPLQLKAASAEMAIRRVPSRARRKLSAFLATKARLPPPIATTATVRAR